MLINEHDKSETQSDIVKELIRVETDEILLNESTGGSCLSQIFGTMKICLT